MPFDILSLQKSDTKAMSYSRGRYGRRGKSWTSKLFWLLVIGGGMYFIDSIYFSKENKPSYMREKLNGYLPDTFTAADDIDYRDVMIEAQPKEFSDESGIRRKAHFPLVVLSTGGGLWNTGVWPGWGGDDPKRSVLNWAASGVVVEKTCDVQCVFTHDNRPQMLAKADAVVMELINHPKFLGTQAAKGKPIPWPEQRAERTPLVYNFFFEAAEEYYEYTIDPALKEHVHATIAPMKDSTLPITLICPWGRGRDAYSKPPPAKHPDRPIAYFNEHGIAQEYDQYAKKFMDIMGDDQVHRYIQMKNRDLPEDAVSNPYTLESRLQFLGTYKFHIVTEPTIYPDWIEPEWSHTLIAGSVPIYFGAPNINDYAPGPKSFINANDFETPQELANLVKYLLVNDHAYKQYFKWKQIGPSQQFMTHVDHCAHYAECRICQHIHRNW